MKMLRHAISGLALLLVAAPSWADRFDDTIEVFQDAGESGEFFDNCYGYAVFPTVGKGAFWVGGAYGSGQVYVGNRHVGDTSMTQISIGFQMGGEAFSQIVFFEDQRAFDEFAKGNFEFGARASAVAITAGVGASATTAGSSAGASGGKNNAAVVGGYRKGMAVFTVAKGGLMYEASVAGQKFTYSPL